MNKKGHLRGGLVTISLTIGTYYYVFDIDNFESGAKLGLLSVGILFGSFLPDLDADRSYIRKKMKTVAFFYDRLKKYKRFRHRGSAMHGFWTWWSLLLSGVVFESYLVIGIAFGVFVHHLLDMTTPAGLPSYFELDKAGYNND